MFSFFRRVISAVIGNIQEQEIDDREILNYINKFHSEPEQFEDSETESEELLGKIELPINRLTFKCTHKLGKVTRMCDDYGLIDNIIYFEKNQISPNVVIKENDEVRYTAYKLRENETERVYKIYGLKNDTWESGGCSDGAFDVPEVGTVEEIFAITRTITARVTERKGRELFIESLNLWCDLDKIKASYVPVEGDWVAVEAIVTIDEDVGNLSGEILEVLSVKSFLSKTGTGRVTLWSQFEKNGAIEKDIYFNLLSCKLGYTPSLGDEVTYHAIESDQGKVAILFHVNYTKSYKWRAIEVTPNNKLIQQLSENKNIMKQDAIFNKNGITILPFECQIELQFLQEKTIVLKITNEGEEQQLLRSVKFKTPHNSHLIVTHPAVTTFYIHPKKTKSLYVKCEGKSLGLSRDLLMFHFKNFLIVRRFEIKVVGNDDMDKLLSCNFDTVIRFRRWNNLGKGMVKKGVILEGPRPWKTPKFAKNQERCFYKIPKQLWAICGTKKQDKEIMNALKKYAPYLEEELNMRNYKKKFHTLLYLEEIQIRNQLKEYTIRDASFLQVDEFFVLTVPGLYENRPSIVLGDKIFVQQNLSSSPDEKCITYTGYVYDILEKEVYLKFHTDFSEAYNKAPCDVYFEPNVGFYSKCHTAVDRVVETHGEEWLFPNKVAEKPPQIDFEISEECQALNEKMTLFFSYAAENEKFIGKEAPQGVETMESVDSIEKNMSGMRIRPAKKKLVWANKELNDRQKLAVINVLRATTRPLPYIIFGPPGTGKTVTLVEIIIQIYRLIPESRILVTTPSNSSADLITERLIDMENLNPGQLVRSVALYRVWERLIPNKLIPYTTFFEQGFGVGKHYSDVNTNNEVIKPSKLNEMIGKHRIMVSTCVSSGNYHYFGLSNGHFTHILIDEAGQTSEPEILMSTIFQNLDKGQVVLTGDPQQLGPVIFSASGKKWGLGVSLLQRIISKFPYARDMNAFPETSGYDPRLVTQLLINYRTVPEILSLSSQMFYNSELIPTTSSSEGREGEIIKRANIRVGDSEKPAMLIFHGIMGQNYQESDSPSWYNPHELWQTVIYLKHLYGAGFNCSDIGIISPYAKQGKKLKALLPSLGLSIPKIGSVEEFQGQERDIIILTTVRSSPKNVATDVIHSLGFIASPNRLNVALTRARALLIIIGNPNLLVQDPYWKTVLKYCKENNYYLGCSLDEDLLEYETFDEEHDEHDADQDDSDPVEDEN